MTLNCNAHNCAYNNSGTCYAGSIKVIGSEANSTSGTKCSTFTPEDNNNLTNINSNYFTTSSDINCKAKKCNYNINSTCNAPSVLINMNNATCETFIS